MLQVDLFRNAGISEEDIQKLQMAVSVYQEARKQPQHKMPHIVCTGIYNAGKSTLLNALIGEDRFPTGDIPTTKALAQAESGGAVYIDTPGLNAAEEDDAETQAAYATADFILFVSNAQGGGVTEAEAAWLGKLKERYPGESLKRRLIYVLTHCTQVDEAQLPAIREHVCADLEKAVGFAPEQTICVDSVTYQKGKKEGKPLLVEDGGIHHLQRRIAERVKEADTLLAQAREAEIVSRRKDALEQIMQVRSTVQSAVDGAEKQGRTKAAEIDRVWAEFEKAIQDKMPPRSIRPVYRPYLDVREPSGNSRKERSKSSTRHDAQDKLERYQTSLYNEVGRASDKVIRDIRQYTRPGIDSAYFEACCRINQVFTRYLLELQKLGITILNTDEIVVEVELPSNIDEALHFRMASGIGLPKTVGEYIDSEGVQEWSDFERNFWGGQSLRTYYYYGLWSIASAMRRDMEDIVKENVDDANDYMNDLWRDFRNKLEEQIAKRNSALKQQVDDYKAALSQSSAPANLLAALAHLDTLKREVSQ